MHRFYQIKVRLDNLMFILKCPSSCADGLTQICTVRLPVWQYPPHDCWYSECCHHFPEPVDSERSSSHRWSSLYAYLAFFGEGEPVNMAWFKWSIHLCCMRFTQYGNLAWGLPIVNQQVSFHCSYCQQRAGLGPQDEWHLIFAGTNNIENKTQII